MNGIKLLNLIFKETKDFVVKLKVILWCPCISCQLKSQWKITSMIEASTQSNHLIPPPPHKKGTMRYSIGNDFAQNQTYFIPARRAKIPFYSVFDQFITYILFVPILFQLFSFLFVLYKKKLYNHRVKMISYGWILVQFG